jgi:hypothetical protein
MMDPILTPLILGGLGVAAGSTAFTVAGVAVTYGALAHVLSFVIVAGISVGLYLATAPPVPKAEDGKVAVQQPVPPRQYCYGLARMSGAIVLRETNLGPFAAGGHGGNLATVYALASHEVDAFRHVYLNDNRVTFGSAVAPATDDHVVDPGPNGRYTNKVFITVRYGLVPETYMNVFTPHNFSAGPWPSTARGDGIASLAMVCEDATQEFQQIKYPYGAPNASAVLAGYKVFDPRVAAGQDPADPTTWTWSDNPVMHILHFLCFSEFGFRYPYDVAIAPVVSDWAHAVSICAEDVLVKPVVDGLTIHRYESGGFATTDNEPKAVLREMLNACDGWLVRRGDGSCLIRVGKFEASGVEITDADILGFAYQRGVGDDEAVNRLDLQFTSQFHHWTQIECDPWNDNGDQTARGHVRETTMDLKWVQDYRQARRIGKREFYRQREPLRGSIDLYLSGINAAYERWIYINSDRIPALSNRYIENRSARFVLTGDIPSIHIEFLGVDPTALEDWDPDTDEGKAPPVLDDFV